MKDAKYFLIIDVGIIHFETAAILNRINSKADGIKIIDVTDSVTVKPTMEETIEKLKLLSKKHEHTLQSVSCASHPFDEEKNYINGKKLPRLRK